MMIPRIRGRVGQATEPKEYEGKWFFYIWISDLGEGDAGDPIGPAGPFETEEKAQVELREACRRVCEKFERMENGAFSGKYIDMKDNITKEWTKP